jgi:hypothetical protein
LQILHNSQEEMAFFLSSAKHREFGSRRLPLLPERSRGLDGACNRSTGVARFLAESPLMLVERSSLDGSRLSRLTVLWIFIDDSPLTNR